MKKSLGDKRKFIDDSQKEQLLKIYESFEENEYSKIFDNDFFGYTKITIERPKVENGQIVRDKRGNPKPDSKLKDSERVSLSRH
jgi:type I restriction enzyme M protein